MLVPDSLSKQLKSGKHTCVDVAPKMLTLKHLSEEPKIPR